MNLIYAHRLSKNKIKVCGIYTDCCVRATVEGMARSDKNSEIEVLSKACAGTSSSGQRIGITKMKTINNVRVW